MSETKYLYIRDDGRNYNKVVNETEDFLRNVKVGDLEDGGFSDKEWNTPVNYRLPYNLRSKHNWKLVRDLKVKEGENVKLSLINKNADQYNWEDSKYSFFNFDLEKIVSFTDNCFSQSVFLVLYPVNKFKSEDEMLRNLVWAYKNEKGELLSIETHEKLYSEERDVFCMMFASLYKLGNLPIYTMFLNNDFVINKVWFRNIEENSKLVVYAENNDIEESIFYPTFNNDVQKIGKNILYTPETFTIDLYGIEEWESSIGRQEKGAEIVLDKRIPPSIGDQLKIDSDLEYDYDGSRYIKFKHNKKNGYLKLNISAGTFFDEFNFNFNYEYLVTLNE